MNLYVLHDSRPPSLLSSNRFLSQCRDYTCCGLNLTNLHALVQHFDECHVVVLDPYAPQQPLPPTTTLLPTPAGQRMPSYYPNVNTVSSQQRPQCVQGQQQTQSIAYQGFDPDDPDYNDLNVDQKASSALSSRAPLAPDMPISIPLSGYPSPTLSVLTYSAAPSSRLSPPVSPMDTTTVLPSRGTHHHSHHTHPQRSFRPAGPSTAVHCLSKDALNANYSSLLPGAERNTSLFMQQGTALAPMNDSGSQEQNDPGSGNGENKSAMYVPTALLLRGSAGNTPDSMSASSPLVSPILGSGGSAYRVNTQASSSGPVYSSGTGSSSSNATASSSGVAQTARASTTLSRSASRLLLSKPFNCPRPNCNKSYKQVNGLKYHITHGTCNFAQPKDLEHLQGLLAGKQFEKAAATGFQGQVTLSDAELREVKKEAERRLKLYACGVGECQRRYKNMNGLRKSLFLWCYHYQHSGDHGAIGLALLASGQHECLQHNKSCHAVPSHSSSNSAPSRPQTHLRAASPPLSHQQPQPQPQPPTYQSALANPPVYSYQPQHQPSPYARVHKQYVVQTQQQLWDPHMPVCCVSCFPGRREE
ncbi:hypothetical protein LXA43DRAFT_1101923 [Ganoderma leucocontextum]|nr:hypothetical protein LXA43DRAFT_1101923 [Ganoderma leucocontextum]